MQERQSYDLKLKDYQGQVNALTSKLSLTQDHLNAVKIQMQDEIKEAVQQERE